MILQCNGVNYDLMSEQEKISVEEGFVQFLNTLRFPIQLYIQSRTLNLRDIIATYKSRVDTLASEIDKLDTKIAQAKAQGNRALMEKLQFERKRINKVNGVKEYESFKKGLEIPKTAFLPNKLVFFVFFLPISLLFNIVTIVVGSPLTLLYCTFPYPFIMITIIMALSILLCHYFYERDNRYIVFFNRFEKDSLLKRVVWVIGTFFAFILLLALNLKLMFNIIDMGRHQTLVLH